MKITAVVTSLVLLAGLALGSSAFAQAPSGSTGQCKDGTYTSAESKRGACAGHGGVKEWYATDKKSESKGEKKAESQSTGKESASKAPASTKKAAEGMRAEPAPGGGAGKVWVNTSSKVYHCSGDQWYGKTKEGEYMTEAQAKASGAHPAHKKTCG